MISLSLRHFVIAVSFIFLPASLSASQYTDGIDLAISGHYSQAYAKLLPLALEGNPQAQFNLGLMYHGGLHVTLDEEKALFWYHRAAENGLPEAQEYLIIGYQEGWFGLTPDKDRAFYWQTRLANGS